MKILVFLKQRDDNNLNELLWVLNINIFALLSYFFSFEFESTVFCFVFFFANRLSLAYYWLFIMGEEWENLNDSSDTDTIDRNSLLPT